MKIYRIAEIQTIGPVYHGTPYEFKLEEMYGNRDGVFEAIQKSGFNIIKSREKGKTTYAVLQSAEILPVK